MRARRGPGVGRRVQRPPIARWFVEANTRIRHGAQNVVVPLLCRLAPRLLARTSARLQQPPDGVDLTIHHRVAQRAVTVAGGLLGVGAALQE